MGLFKPAWQNKDPKKALRAVEEVTDETVLVRIAKEHGRGGWTGARKAAAEKISNQDLLADLVKYGDDMSDSCIREVAARKITRQDILTDVVKNDKAHLVRRAALDNLTDQTVLTYVAKEDSDSSVRIKAAKKLVDQSTAQEILFFEAKQPSYVKFPTDRIAAVNALTDQTRLAEIAVSEKDMYVFRAAFEKITDAGLLERIVERCSHDWVKLKPDAVPENLKREIEQEKRVEHGYHYYIPIRCKRCGTYSYFSKLD